ncbi:MAG: hypothetical protein ACRCUI_04420, partial [Polymorphobacter sp.]
MLRIGFLLALTGWTRAIALRGLPIAALLLVATGSPLRAQVALDPWEDQRVEAVRITFVNPSADPADRAAIEDSARKALGLFPGSGFRGLLLDWGLGKVSALARVATATADLAPGAAGGVVVTLTLTLGD